jgi:hypothetical protein
MTEKKAAKDSEINNIRLDKRVISELPVSKAVTLGNLETVRDEDADRQKNS